MLVIRFARYGRKRIPHFKIVVQEKTKHPKRKFLDLLGYYNPRLKSFKIDEEKLKKYVSDGAQVSNSVARVLSRDGIKGYEKFIKNIDKKIENLKSKSIQEKTKDEKKEEKVVEEMKKDNTKEEVKEETKEEVKEDTKEEPKEEKPKDK